MDLFVSTISATFLGLYVLAWMLLRSKHDSREPPLVDSWIPFLSPMIATAWRGLDHWHAHTHLPLYTLRAIAFRIYVVNSTALIPIVQRRVNTISFNPFLVQMSARFMAVSRAASEIVQRNPLSPNGFISGMNKTTHLDLSPGAKLDSLNQRAADVLTNSIDRLTHSSSHLKMKQWVYHEITMATTEGIYGPLNPFRDSAIHAIWNTYEAGLFPLLANILPFITARKYAQARESLVDRYQNYYSQGGHSHPDASAFIRNRYKFYLDQGIPLPDIARIEVGAAIGLISNTKPGAFWLLYHIASNPIILHDCRQELQGGSRKVDSRETVIDIAYIKDNCPILLSTLKEAFRFHGIGVSLRMVLEDEDIQGSLLKKDSILMIPATIQHNSISSWGDDVAHFNHKRFLRTPHDERTERRLNPVAFRGFGGGATLCPGRHFASTEILIFVSLVILNFEIRPHGGHWPVLSVKNSNPGIALHQPDQDLDIELIPSAKGTWRIGFTDSSGPMMISAEDIESINGEATSRV